MGIVAVESATTTAELLVRKKLANRLACSQMVIDYGSDFFRGQTVAGGK
jgi:hypothetical protein